jgi:serine/threonine protein kinase/WD40 repeat protein
MNEESIFAEALGKTDQERAAFLDRHCQDDVELRRRLEALLKAHDHPDPFLEIPDPVAATMDMQPQRETTGTVIGPYKLLEQIGEGGFGVVFMALQQEPIRRKVALKILKPGMDTRQVIARFEAERQALALMDHPNIAKVLDAGQTSSGRPYFVMDLVKGLPITDYCDQNQLAPRDRLELFMHVCQAVQHAHQKGIIHRDLKPSNVLVTLHDGAPLVKIIDFGIAKALGRDLTDKTLFTGFAQLIGTPLYMSPEQTAFSNIDVDTRSDIYSLGVLLYELLTGTTPFDKDRLRQAAGDEIWRIIREEEPPKPSSRISTLGQAASTVSTQRKSDPKRLSQLFRGELDWIVMKALDKDRGGRYETASAFAADVQHYLKDEAVQACPPSPWYRLRKLARRNKLLFVTSTVVAATLLVAITTVTWKWLEAETAREEAEGAHIRASDAEQIARQREQRAVTAEHKTRLREAEALLGQARGTRLSRRPGQRFDALAAVRKAAAIGRELGQPAPWFDSLRNEAIAALALPDVRLVKALPSRGSVRFDFDPGLEHYFLWDRTGSVSIRRLTDDTEICRVSQIPSNCGYLHVSPDGRYLSYQFNGRVHVTALVRKTGTRLLDQEGDTPTFSTDGREFAFQDPGGSILLIDPATWKLRRRLEPSPRVSRMAFHPKGGRLALALRDSSEAHVRDLGTGAVLGRAPLGRDWWTHVAWHPEGNILATAGDRVVYLWDIAARRELAKLEGFTNSGINLAFDSAGTVLATWGWEHKLRLWDTYTGRQILAIPAVVHSVRSGPDGRFLAAMELDNRLGLWEITVPQEYRTLTCGPAHRQLGYWLPCVSSDNRLLVGGSEPGAGLWDLSSGKPLALLQNLHGPNHVLLQPAKAGAGALLTNGPGGLFRWPIDREQNGALWRIGPPERLAIGGSFCEIGQSRNGDLLASVNQQHVTVLHADQPDRPVQLGGHADARFVAVSPDGQWVASGGFGHPGGAKVWQVVADSKLGKRIGRLRKDLPVGGHCHVCFSPDSKRLLTIGDRTLRLWEVGSWKEVTWPVPQSSSIARQTTTWVGGANFSPDGRILAVETGFGAARLLDPETGKEYARLEDPNQERAVFFGFSPDGTLLVTATDGPALHVWDLRLIRQKLAGMDLNWDLPRYPPSSPLSAHDAPLQVMVYHSWVERGLDHERQGQAEQALAAYRRAAADYAKLLAAAEAKSSEPGAPLLWYENACLHLRIGDVAAYRKLCARMLDRFGHSKNSHEIGVLGYTCLLGPDALNDSRLTLELAQKLPTMTPVGHDHDIWTGLILGLAYYRAGRHDKALESLEKAISDYPDWDKNVLNWLVLAMAHQRLRHVKEGQQWLEKAKEWIADKRRAASQETGFVPPGWHWRDWLTVQLLRREAESLLQGKDKDKRKTKGK